MSADTATQTTPTLPPRAAVALLTLKVRAAQQEAEQAEAQAAAAESAAAGAPRHATPDQTVDRRTREMEAVLARVREEATGSIAAAHQEAGRIVAAATPIPTVASPSTTLLPVHHGAPAQGFDAEVFARTFATVFAGVIEERMPRLGAAAPSAPQPLPKKSFWATALHVDVVLLAVATTIVVGVLLAWMA